MNIPFQALTVCSNCGLKDELVGFKVSLESILLIQLNY